MDDQKPDRPADPFYVSFHDITPVFSKQILRLIDAIAPLIGTQWSAAVVPQWHGESISSYDSQFIELLSRTFGEILLHGYFHRRERGRGPVSFLANGADEFNGLSIEETELRIMNGQRVMSELFGKTSLGFVPPAFRHGRLSPAMLARHGIEFIVGFSRAEFRDGRRLPLNTWCWDVGPNLALCRAGDMFSTLRQRLYPQSVPQITIHPVDADRGFLDRILQLIRSQLDAGRRPMLRSDFPATPL